MACPAGGERALTGGEIALARTVFGDAIDYAAVTIRRWKWFPFQPRKVTMAPRGHIHFHPEGHNYCDDFAQASLHLQGHFVHEMVHVWQAQKKGRWYLPLHRPFSRRYDYSLRPGWSLEQYGIEQQAEIVRHAFLLRRGAKIAGVANASAYDLLVNFPGSAEP
ncbi:MAG: vgr related protein [Sphingomonadaceae bacterium]|nr:vgr related protein [Sphingomonadaceae bacterium]